MDDVSFRDRVLAALTEQKLSVAEAARRSGVSYDTIRDLKRRANASTSAENAAKIARALMIPMDGISTPVRVENGESAPDEAALVPVYEVDASAGPGSIVDSEEQVHSLAFPPFYLNKIAGRTANGLAVIGVKGDSMEPTLPDDSIVLIDTTKKNLGYDGLFVLRIDEVLHVKRIGRGTRSGNIMIISDNKDLHPAFERAIGDIEAIGKVLWYGRKV